MQNLRDKIINWYFRQEFIKRGKYWVTQSIIRKYFQRIICQTKDGLWFEIDPRDMVQLSILTTGEWEPEETQAVKENLNAGQVFYDIGANYGYFSLLAARLVGENGHVYAFEPNPHILKMFERNLALNKITNVSIIPYAVSNQSSEREFHLSKSTNSGLTSFRQLGNRNQTIKIRTICLDEYIKANNLQLPDFIKMDVEGAEYLALSGMETTISIKNQVKLLMEVTDSFLRQVAGDEATLLAKAKEYGLNILRETSRDDRMANDGSPYQYVLLLEKNCKNQ